MGSTINCWNISCFEERSVSWIASFCHEFFKKTKNYLRGFLMVLSFDLIEWLFPYAPTSFLCSKCWKVCRVDLRFSLHFLGASVKPSFIETKHPPDKTYRLTKKKGKCKEETRLHWKQHEAPCDSKNCCPFRPRRGQQWAKQMRSLLCRGCVRVSRGFAPSFSPRCLPLIHLPQLILFGLMFSIISRQVGHLILVSSYSADILGGKTATEETIKQDFCLILRCN